MYIDSPSKTSEGEQAEQVLAEQAMSLFAERRFADAARAFEMLAVETSGARYLFNAAVARERLGHEARAYVHLRRFLANEDLTAKERRQGKTRLAELIERTVPLRIELMPPPGGEGWLVLYLLQGAGKRRPIEIRIAEFALPDRPGAVELQVEAGTWFVHTEVPGTRPAQGQVTITYPDSGVLTLNLEEIAPATPEVPLSLTLSPRAVLSAGARARVLSADGEQIDVVPLTKPTTRLDLEPGRYQLQVSADGFATQTLEVSVEGREASVDVHLSEQVRSPRQRRKHNPEMIVMGALGGVAWLSGVALLAPAAAKFPGLRDNYVDSPFGEGCGGALAGDYCLLTKNLERQGAGAGLLGVAGGSALSMGLSLRRTRASAWIEFGVGAAFALGGSVLLRPLAKRFPNAGVCKNDPTRCTEAAIDQHRLLAVTTGAGLGFGGSLVVGGLMKVLLRGREHRRPLASTYLSPSGAGVALSGRF